MWSPLRHGRYLCPRAGRTFVNPADVGPRQQTGRGYSTSSGLTERWRTAQLKRPNSGPTAWQRGQTLELKDGPTSNPRKRGDETNPLGLPPFTGEMSEGQRGHTPARGGNVRSMPRTPIRGTKGAHPQPNTKNLHPPQAIPTHPPPLRSAKGTRAKHAGDARKRTQSIIQVIKNHGNHSSNPE